MGIKEKYQELSKKYKLPSFNDIDNEFEISTIEEDAFLLREIRRKIAERIECYTDILENVLNPESLTNMLEARIFDDNERNEIFKINQKLMFLSRLSVEISIGEDDKKSSDYINQVFSEWDGIKKQYLKFIRKIKDSWTKETDGKEELKYMG